MKRLRRALEVKEKESQERLGMLGRARHSLHEAYDQGKKAEHEKNESLEAMTRLHSVLKAATEALDSDGENENQGQRPNGAAAGIALDSSAEELLSRMMM